MTVDIYLVVQTLDMIAFWLTPHVLVAGQQEKILRFGVIGPSEQAGN
jgi:hypothetical protein